MSYLAGPSAPSEASTSTLAADQDFASSSANRPAHGATAAGAGGEGMGQDKAQDVDELAEGGSSVELSAATEKKIAKAAKGGAGPGKGWRAGRGGGAAGKRQRKKPEIEEPPNKYRDKFIALRDSYDLAIKTKEKHEAELDAALDALNRIQEENDFLLDAARKTLPSRPSLAYYLQRTTSPPPTSPAASDVPPQPPAEGETETRIAGPVAGEGANGLPLGAADEMRQTKRQRVG